MGLLKSIARVIPAAGLLVPSKSNVTRAATSLRETAGTIPGGPTGLAGTILNVGRGLAESGALRGTLGRALTPGGVIRTAAAVPGPTTVGGVGASPGALITPAMSVVGPAARVAATVVFSILTKAAIRLGLTRLSLKGAMNLIRRLGPTAGGVAMGLAVDEVATLIIADSQKRRIRTRGIGARDVRTVRRAQRVVARARKLASTFPGATASRRRRHKAGCACIVCRRG